VPFADDALRQFSRVILGLQANLFNLPNPYTSALASSIPGNFPKNSSLREMPGNNKVLLSTLQVGSVLLCNASVWDIEYTSTNGSMNFLKGSLSHLDTSQTINAPVTILQKSVESFLKSSVAIALFQSYSGAEVLRRFAAAYSRVTLALGASSLDEKLGISQRQSTKMIVARVPTAPLWSVVVGFDVYRSWVLLYRYCLAGFLEWKREGCAGITEGRRDGRYQF
jgi:hypothetical protein